MKLGAIETLLLCSLLTLSWAKTYDYIVVGAGTAGSALAAGLVSQHFDVLVLEEGPIWQETTPLPYLTTPHMIYRLWNSPEVSNQFNSEKDPTALGRRFKVITGRGLGGTSQLSQIYSVPDFTDFDDWATLGWTSTILQNVFAPLQAQIPHSAGPTGSLVSDFIQSAQFAHLNLSDFTDGSTAHSQGVQESQYFQSGPYSLNANLIFLDPIKNLPNFHLQTDSRVTRVLFDQFSSPMVATGVEYISGGKTSRVYCRKEVILAAGVFGSPKILEMSGIGNSSFLASKGITPIVDLPNVGENLITSIGVNVVFLGKQVHVEQNFTKYYDPAEYMNYGNGQGFFTYHIAHLSGAFSSQGASKPDVYFEHSTVLPPFQLPEAAFDSACITNKPEHRGSTHVKNNDPFTDPSVVMNSFSSYADLDSLIACIEMQRTIASIPPLSNDILTELLPSAAFNTSQGLSFYILGQSLHTYHDFGTCAIGSVVDPTLKVIGFDNLRVVDASIVPKPLGGPVMSLYAIGSYAAQLIGAANYVVNIDMTRGLQICNGFHGYRVIKTQETGDTDVCKSIGARNVMLNGDPTNSCQGNEALDNLAACGVSSAWIGMNGSNCQVLSQSGSISTVACSNTNNVLCKQ